MTDSSDISESSIPSIHTTTLELEDDIDTNKIVLSSSICTEVLDAIYDARYLAPFLSLLGFILAYQITIAPYSSPIFEKYSTDIDTLARVRPKLTTDEILMINRNTMYAETLFALPEPSSDFVKLKFHTHVSSHGNFQPPDIFYNGVIFGLTAENSHGLEFSARRSHESSHEAATAQLRLDILNLSPFPTSIMPRSSRNNETDWVEDGYAVYFSLTDLERQGKISSDKMKPWIRAQESVLRLARKYRQTYVFRWYQHSFGEKIEDQPHVHQNIIQEIIPTRTGYNGIKSSVVVWLSSINFTEPLPPDKVVQRPWTDDDHWTHFPKDLDELHGDQNISKREEL